MPDSPSTCRRLHRSRRSQYLEVLLQVTCCSCPGAYCRPRGRVRGSCHGSPPLRPLSSVWRALLRVSWLLTGSRTQSAAVDLRKTACRATRYSCQFLPWGALDLGGPKLAEIFSSHISQSSFDFLSQPYPKSPCHTPPSLSLSLSLTVSARDSQSSAAFRLTHFLFAFPPLNRIGAPPRQRASSPPFCNLGPQDSVSQHQENSSRIPSPCPASRVSLRKAPKTACSCNGQSGPPEETKLPLSLLSNRGPPVWTRCSRADCTKRGALSCLSRARTLKQTPPTV